MSILVTKSSMPPYEEYCEEIKDIWDTRWLTNMGEKHELLQKELKEYLKVPYVSLCTNGHSALQVALQALGLQGEIITTPFTFVSTTEAIVRSGCKPVFCDIDPLTYTIDTNKIENLITDKTCAIMPVHVYGNVCDVDKIQHIADKYNLKVIYDAAHAFGVEVGGKGIASFGDVSVFSFHATKVFHTIEGGAICCASKKLFDKINIIRDFGITDSEHVDYIGTNAKMNEFSAAMGICNLRYIDKEILRRKHVYEKYVECLSSIDGITMLNEVQGLKRNYAYFPIIVNASILGVSRDDIQRVLADNGIYTRKYFYPLTNDFSCISSIFDKGQTDVARGVASNVLTLPMFADLRDRDILNICNKIKEML
nr:DegT/DnrJ/EryC1/StrS family aminotransferase [Agathobacter rectalis]